MSLIQFFKYNNLFPVTLSLLLLSFGGALAASPTVRQDASALVYARDEAITGVDNTYLIDRNLRTYDPTIRIAAITEDSDAYYVAYELGTIGLADGIWQEILRTESVTVPKSFLVSLNLGQYLSLYFDELTEKEKRLLTETQDIERAAGRSTRQVATTYRGLVGEFFDTDERILPGYTPPEPEPEPEPVLPTEPEPNDDENPPPTVDEDNDEPPTEPSAPNAPQITLVGENPQEIEVGAVYAELGVLLSDTEDAVADIALVITDDIDTATPGSYSVIYTATDSDGNESTMTRTVIVVEEEPLVVEEPAGEGEPEESIPLPPPAETPPAETEGESEASESVPPTE